MAAAGPIKARGVNGLGLGQADLGAMAINTEPRLATGLELVSLARSRPAERTLSPGGTWKRLLVLSVPEPTVASA